MRRTDCQPPRPSEMTAHLRVVTAAPRAHRRDPLPRPPAPAFSGFELAAEMGELFAMALLRDTAFDLLSDPHACVTVAGSARFTLHELLCELRSLAWCDATAACLPAADSASHSRVSLGEPDHRRAMRWNGDGQLTLHSLFAGAVARAAGPVRPSRLLACVEAPEPRASDISPPEETAPLSAWVAWCAATSGALAPHGDRATADLPQTPAGLAEHILSMPAARPFHGAAMTALAAGARFDAGLSDSGAAWTASRLFHLMSRAEADAKRVALLRAAEADRLSRPAVTAARMSVYLARDQRQASPEMGAMHEAADELAMAAPSLLRWMSTANAGYRKRSRLSDNLFLPILSEDQIPPHPADLAPVATISGALATLLKAVLDTAPRAVRAGDGVPACALAEEADRLAANIAMARSVLATHYPAENHQDLRIGETIALQALRATLEADNRSASLEFTDFDGRALRIVAHPRSFGRGYAELWRDGDPVAWPQDLDRPAAHLTAVI